ncbi:MAG: hypothetical protein KA886_09005 [Candidatus Cloacimonetes bacterium]|jgi:hypothetical protein|nr:hypothetical protein [Candidatus Cloacimonadota bacterium]HPM01068.1 hypothetical protein [Candidatus Cloacimonadota bacterium]
MKVLRWILINLLIIVSGCDVFSPRDAENPEQPAAWHTFQVTPAKTLENLVYAYNYRENVYNYTNLFFDTFYFYFDNQDASDFSIPSYWTKSSEIDMLMNTWQRINPGSSMELTLTPIPSQGDNIQTNRAWFFRTYQLTIAHSLTDIPTLFTGKFQIYMEKDNNGFWKIKEWYDYRLTSSWTWGRMKNEFSL